MAASRLSSTRQLDHRSVEYPGAGTCDASANATGATGSAPHRRTVTGAGNASDGVMETPKGPKEGTQEFWGLVDKSGSCWTWAGTVSGKGYGYVRRDGRSQRAHRVAYEMVVGPIPEGLHLDHLCRNRLCVNPGHLEPVTNRTNALRGNSPNAIIHRTNRCKHGHSMDDARVSPKGRDCRTCHNLRAKRYRAAKQAGGAS